MIRFKTLAASACALALTAGAALAQQYYKPPFAQDLSGVWLIEGDKSTVLAADGKLPPMTKAAADAYAAAVKARAAGAPVGDSIRSCWPHGLPRLMFAKYPFEILQEQRQVTFVHEVHHMPRMVYLDAQLPPLEDLDPNWMGFSAGRWEGDTLVVESAGFNEKTTVDQAGLPHSSEMKLVERIRKLDADTLEDVITVTDPKTYTRSWSTRATYKRQPAYRIKEYVCTDANPEADGK